MRPWAQPIPSTNKSSNVLTTRGSQVSDTANGGLSEATKDTGRVARWGVRREEMVLAFALVLPAVLWVLTFVLYPVLYNFALSFETDLSLDGLRSASLELYSAALSDPDVWKQVGLTLLWTGGNLLLIVPVGMGIALLLNQELPGLRRIRSWILLPWIFPVIIIVLLWRLILDPNVGVFNYVLQVVGLAESPVNFLGQSLAMFTVILTNAWRWIPFFAIVMLAALQNVPRELHESAAVDGATAFRRFWSITLPQLYSSLVVNVFILTMFLFNMFPPIWLMTRGGPGEATTTVPVGLYRTAFELFQIERGAVLTAILLVFVAGFSILYWLTLGRRFERG